MLKIEKKNLKSTRKQLTHRIFHATCELHPPFYVNFFLTHTRSKIDFIIRQLKINYPDKIKGHNSYNNETYILYNICGYSSNVISTLESHEAENESENCAIHVTISTYIS